MRKFALFLTCLGMLTGVASAHGIDGYNDNFNDRPVAECDQSFMPQPGHIPPTVQVPIDDTNGVASYLSQEVYGTSAGQYYYHYNPSDDRYYEGGVSFRYYNGSFSKQTYQSNRTIIPDTAYTIYGNPAAYAPIPSDIVMPR